MVIHLSVLTCLCNVLFSLQFWRLFPRQNSISSRWQRRQVSISLPDLWEVCLSVVPLKILCLSSLDCFYDVLSWVLSCFPVTYLGVLFFAFILVGICRFFVWTCGIYLLSVLENSWLLSLHILPLPYSVFSSIWALSFKYVRYFHHLHLSLMLFSVFSISHLSFSLDHFLLIIFNFPMILSSLPLCLIS